MGESWDASKGPMVESMELTGAWMVAWKEPTGELWDAMTKVAKLMDSVASRDELREPRAGKPTVGSSRESDWARGVKD